MAKQTKLSNGTRLYDKDIVILQRGYEAQKDAVIARYWNDEFKAMERLDEAGLTKRTNVVYYSTTDAGIAALRELGLIDAAPQAEDSGLLYNRPQPLVLNTFQRTYAERGDFKSLVTEMEFRGYGREQAQQIATIEIAKHASQPAPAGEAKALEYRFHTKTDVPYTSYIVRSDTGVVCECANVRNAIKITDALNNQARIAALEADNKRLQALFDACTSEANDTSVEHVMALEQQIEALEAERDTLRAKLHEAVKPYIAGGSEYTEDSGLLRAIQTIGERMKTTERLAIKKSGQCKALEADKRALVEAAYVFTEQLRVEEAHYQLSDDDEIAITVKSFRVLSAALAAAKGEQS